MKQRSRSILWIAGSIAVVPAMAGATWWLVGDLSTTPGVADYVVHPPSIAAGTERAVGVSLTALCVAYCIAYFLNARRTKSTWLWLPVAVSLMLAGAFLGYGARILTAGVVGANVGAGLWLFFGTPIVVVLLGVAIGWAVVVQRGLRTVNAPGPVQ